MEYMGDKQYWDEKFEQRSDKPLNPEKSLVENIKYLKKGSVLDVACGDGRNTLFLLQNKFKVTGIDFSNKALQRLERFTKRNKYSVDVKQVDLTMPDSLKNIGIFDNIVINYYRLKKEQIDNIKSNLSDIGIL
ncbi:class I SAM-dependent methyltransferase [Haloimpatiens sp. FM7330]|uniref:class I SAM-dependent methyltransferase n=1 Tax=Haloimpatiens sp. FM7330 TaxID=3298610 RepID=UPI0036354789